MYINDSDTINVSLLIEEQNFTKSYHREERYPNCYCSTNSVILYFQSGAVLKSSDSARRNELKMKVEESQRRVNNYIRTYRRLSESNSITYL
jgi:hypothetical protein